MTEPHPQGALEPGYRLLWYRIGRILGRGAFGVTYLAEDINLHRPVAIKEFFPSQYCSRRSDSAEIRPLSENSEEDFRWAMERFLTEARTLAHFEHPNIIRVINVFEQNGTAYMVMHYESGLSLSALLKRRRTLKEGELTKLLIPILDGLEKVHASGFIHRDIKPSNIYIREGGSPVLLDFGSARQSMQEHTQTLTSLVSPGYAPIEQYTSKGDRQGPWTDIYGLGATLYRAVTGLLPPSAIDRSEALSEGKEDYMTRASELVRTPYSEAFLNAIDHALAFSVDKRPQSVANWRTEFGFTLGDIDTQPEYNTNRYAQSQTAENELPATAGQIASSEADYSEIINIADTDSEADSEESTAVNSGPAEQEADNSKKMDTESPTERIDAVNSGQTGRLPIYMAASAVIALAIGALLLNGESEKVRQIDLNTDGNEVMVLPVETAIEQPDAASQPPSRSRQIKSLLAAAREDLDAQRLTTPADNNAYDKFQQVLQLDPDNRPAKRGIEAVYNRYLQFAQRATQADDFDKASAMLDKAASVIPQGPGLMRARVALEQRRTELRMESLSTTVSSDADSAPEPVIEAEQSDPSTAETFRRRLGGQR